MKFSIEDFFMENFVFVQCLTMASIQHAKQYLNLHRTNVVVMLIEVA